jgi:hypothetical protein
MRASNDARKVQFVRNKLSSQGVRLSNTRPRMKSLAAPRLTTGVVRGG